MVFVGFVCFVLHDMFSHRFSEAGSLGSVSYVVYSHHIMAIFVSRRHHALSE